MNKLSEIKAKLDSLSEFNTEIFHICQDIVAYLELHPKQVNLTIGGMKAVIATNDEKAIIQAAFTLTLHPFCILDVRYRLYDEALEEVIQELDQESYSRALQDEFFVDENGYEIPFEELNKRLFPYFINLVEATQLYSGRLE